MTRLTIGSLCSGSGMMDHAVAEHFDARVIWHCESDEDASLVLKHHHPDVPNHGDLTAVDWSTVERPDILAMGVPCQPVSAAGRQRGKDDERWLWPYAHDAILALRPQWIVFENVRNLISIEKGELWRGILADLRAAGYAVRWLTLGACAVGMPHHRHRVFALAEHVRADAPEAVRLDVRQCGATRSARRVLPSPVAAAGLGQGATRNGRGEPQLLSIAELLLSPRATDGVGGADISTHAEGSPNLRTVASLLLTPQARDGEGRNEGDAEYWERKGKTPSNVGAAVTLPERWGTYAEAVARWSDIFGEPPEPTEPNRNGAPRLRAAFAEWMMGWPSGHVTAIVERNPALRIIGNGVAPQQLTRALVLLSDNDQTTTDWGTMADADVIKQINDKKAARAKRILDAAHNAPDRDDPHVCVDVEVAAAFAELATCLREEADLHAQSKKRGWQSTSTELRKVATHVAAVALDVRALALADSLESGPHGTVDEPAPGDLVLLANNGELSGGIVRDDGSYELDPVRVRATAAYLAGRTDEQPDTLTVTLDNRNATFSPSGSTLADEVKADQMINPEPIPGARMLLDPTTPTYAPISLGPRWTFEDLMSGPIGPPVDRDGQPYSHWSWSQLQGMEDCGLRERFQRIERLPQVPQWALVGGHAFHYCVEQIEAGMAPDTSDLPALWQHWFAQAIAEQAAETTLTPDKWRASNRGSEGWTWWNESGPDMLARYVKWRSSYAGSLLTIAGKPVIEYECELTLPGGIVVKCVIDAAFVRPDSSIEIVDFKTGRTSADMSQLGLYAHALAQQLIINSQTGEPMRRIFGSIFDARKGEASPAVDLLAAHPLAEYVYRVHTAEAKRRAGLYAPRKSSFCGGCSVKYACPLFAGEDS